MRLAILALFAASTLGSGSRRAAVHATLVSSEPAANSRLVASPPRIRLVFSEPVEGKLARISLHPDVGERITLRAGADPRDVHAVIAPVDSLGAGMYRVEWRVVSADGHPVDGDFSFRIGDSALVARADSALGMPVAPAPPPATSPDAGAEQPVWGPAAFGAPLVPAVLRGTGLGALMGLAGMLLMMVGAAPEAAQRTDARVRRIITMCAVLAPLLLTAHLLTWIINTSPDLTFDPSWAASALGTSVGRVELWRVGLTILALWAWWLARRPVLALAFATGALIVSGAVGHSAAIHPEWGIPAKAIHLLASGVWLGGLVWLTVRPAADDVDLFASDAARVSSRALLAVIAVAFTGVVQVRLFLPAWGDLVTSAYGSLALVKTLGLLVLIAFGAHHRQRLIPRLAAAARSATDVDALRRSVAREVVVIAIVIMIGGLLAYVPPPAEGMEDMSTPASTL